jgi:hypothetical protein
MKTSQLLFAASFLGALLCLTAVPAPAGVFISITIAPPMLPVYTQPLCPVDGYLWNPGYWSYGPNGYYWVSGVWVQPPGIGLLWTPGYWGFGNGVYGWNTGYWGPHVGFYGGVNYGFGYGGVGFGGGMWSGRSFRYNTAVVNVNTTVVHNVYVDRTVINNTTVVNNRVSFNGAGGTSARPTAQEQVAIHEQHIQPTANQIAHEQLASRDRSQLAPGNHAAPPVAARNTANNQRPSPQPQVEYRTPPARPMTSQPRNMPASKTAHLTPPQNNPNHPVSARQPHGNPPPKEQNRPKVESEPHERPKPEPHAEKR